MGIENIMYFALGALCAGLLALAIMPAVWRRAVRLTKKRIEAATPITMAEFRADKDQLRAEFALATRRLEMNVEALRRRLSDQLRDINRKRTEVGAIRGERDIHIAEMREHEEREADFRKRILELEKESADIAQRLRMREREFGEKTALLDAAREDLRSRTVRPAELDGQKLSGDYAADTALLIARLDEERRRARLLENQNRSLLADVETTGRRAAAAAAAAELRASLARRDTPATDLSSAEAHIAEAAARVESVLGPDSVSHSNGHATPMLAAQFDEQATLEDLRSKVLTVETTILSDWNTGNADLSRLRDQLGEIAADVSRIVYAPQGTDDEAPGQSLLDRVQKFSDAPIVLPDTEAANDDDGAKREKGAARVPALTEADERN
jgi:hypothetical protein